MCTFRVDKTIELMFIKFTNQLKSNLMKKELLKVAKVLSKSEQVNVGGGFNPWPDPIGPLPPEGGGGGGGNSNPPPKIGVCIDPSTGVVTKVPCDKLCPNGTQPICAA